MTLKNDYYDAIKRNNTVFCDTYWHQYQFQKKDLENTERLMKLEKEKYKLEYLQDIAREKEYLLELKTKMDHELRLQNKWESIKTAKLMTGRWSLIKVTANPAEIVVWCQENLPLETYIPSFTSFRNKEWLVENGDYLTAFTLRWA